MLSCPDAKRYPDTHLLPQCLGRLAYLAPEMLEALVVKRQPPAIRLNEMVELERLPYAVQTRRVFS